MKLKYRYLKKTVVVSVGVANAISVLRLFCASLFARGNACSGATQSMGLVVAKRNLITLQKQQNCCGQYGNIRWHP